MQSVACLFLLCEGAAPCTPLKSHRGMYILMVMRSNVGISIVLVLLMLICEAWPPRRPARLAPAPCDDAAEFYGLL